MRAVQPAVQNELPKSSGQVDGIVGCRGRNPCSPAKTEIQDQAKKRKSPPQSTNIRQTATGEWGEISLDFENGKAEVILLADWDTVKTNKFASRAIAYLLNCENEKLPKEIMVAFE